MKYSSLLSLLLTFSLSVFSLSSYAAQWYHVEVIVFEQLNSITDEKWPVMDIEKARLSPGMANKLIQPAVINSLVGVAARLNKSSKYRVHYHRAWKQPIQTKSRAKSVKIISENNHIEGKIQLYKSTYLHASLNLWLNRENTRLDASPEGTNIELMRNPNLKESRRIRSNKLYFFDHPKMGIMLKITPLKTIPVKVENKLESFSLPKEGAALTKPE